MAALNSLLQLGRGLKESIEVPSFAAARLMRREIVNARSVRDPIATRLSLLVFSVVAGATSALSTKWNALTWL